ncbi:MAG: hypothetical protein H7331_00995 [Bacteroidia bacterium]|nr:hypothetical protein [Bacteroidia bacterium]
MKKLLLLTACVAVITSTKAQTNVYHSFVDTNATWNVTWSSANTCFPANFTSIINYSYTANGTVMYGGKTYIQILRNQISSNNSNCNYTFPYATTILIRNDVANKKVYIQDPSTLQDTVLYDFNLLVGDTVPHWFTNQRSANATPFIIQSIDSVLIGSTYRKKFNLNNTSQVFFIEGIGSSNGLFEDFLIFEESTVLNCYTNDNVTYGICPIVGLNKQKIQTPILSVLSSVTNAETIVNYTLPSTTSSACLELYDITGVLIKSCALSSATNSYLLNMQGVAKGIKLLVLKTNDGFFAKQKLVFN